MNAQNLDDMKPTIVTDNGYTSLWFMPDETSAWANRPGNKWPCSVVAGRELFVEFDPCGNLVDVLLDGKSADIPCAELDAITSDHLPVDHPARR